MSSIMDRFTEARLASGLSQAELARAISLSRSAVSQIESGETKTLKASTLVAFERATGYRASWVETGRGPRKATPGHADQLERTYDKITRLDQTFREKIEADIDFYLKQQERG